MTAMYSFFNQSFNRCGFCAEAASFVPVNPLVDAANYLVVSICVIGLLVLRVII